MPRKDRRYKPRKNMDEVPEINPRSYKLNKTLTKKMCKYIEEGNYITTACKLCGIERHTHYDWMKHGKKVLSRLRIIIWLLRRLRLRLRLRWLML